MFRKGLRKRLTRRAAFTLLEVMVVTTIMTSQANNYGDVKRLAYQKSCQNNLRQIYMGLQMYEISHGELPRAKFYPKRPRKDRDSIVTALGLTGAVLAVLLGPWLVQTLFDAPDVLGHGDFAWLAAATLAYLWAMVLGQALLALDRHRAQAVAWAVGVAALVVATLAPVATALRVELGYAIGSVEVAATMAVLLRARTAGRAPVPAAREAVAPGVTSAP